MCGTDRGAGFNVDELPTDESFIRTGLYWLGMREQLAMIGGHIEITSKINEGTSIQLTIPTTTPTKTFFHQMK